MSAINSILATDSADHGDCPVSFCSPAALQARASIAGDLYREGRITRAECFRIAVDASIGQDSGPIQYEANDDHEFMMTGEGVDHDEYRRREEIYQGNTQTEGPAESGTSNPVNTHG